MQGTQQAAGRAFSSLMVELALSSYPGLYALGPPQAGSAFGVYWPALVHQELLDHTVHHHDGTSETIPVGSPHSVDDQLTPQTPAPPAPPAASPWTADELVVASLGELVHARSGDKGGDANLGVWVRDREAWDWLRATLTVDELHRLLPETRELAITRYELPHLGALNFLIRGLLGDGATSSLRLDAQAKALGEWLRSRTTQGPAVAGEDVLDKPARRACLRRLLMRATSHDEIVIIEVLFSPGRRSPTGQPVIIRDREEIFR